MTVTTSTRHRESPKAAQRREEILQAALKCFREKGFQAASMGSIAREFGMSTGHIYNYFESKEAIIEAIVEKWVSEYIRKTMFSWTPDDALRSEQVHACVKSELEERIHDENFALTFEILAEGMRNEKIAACVRRASRRARAHLLELNEKIYAARKLPLPADIRVRTMVATSIFDGLCVQYASDPESFNLEEVIPLVVRQLEMLHA